MKDRCSSMYVNKSVAFINKTLIATSTVDVSYVQIHMCTKGYFLMVSLCGVSL